MTLEIRNLQSGSSGNGTLVVREGDAWLVDAGWRSQKALRDALAAEGVALPAGERPLRGTRDALGATRATLRGILASHTHGDHINYSTLRVCHQAHVEVHVHRANERAVRNIYPSFPAVLLRGFESHVFTVGPLRVDPFRVPHDAPDVTCGFRISDKEEPEATAVAIVTDLGHWTPSMAARLRGVRLLYLESNYDEGMLADSWRPRENIERVGGPLGHLSNRQCAEFLRRLLATGTRPDRIYLAHLSADHNIPALALETVTQLVGADLLRDVRLSTTLRGNRGETVVLSGP